MKNKISTLFLSKINWLKFLKITSLFLIAFFLNYYLLNKNILANQTESFGTILNATNLISLVLYLFSVAGLSFYVSNYINKFFVLKILLSHLGYLVISYFLLVTRNLNNKEFDIFDFQQNVIYQKNFLLTLLIVLIISIGISFLRKSIKSRHNNRRRKPQKKDKDIERVTLSIIVASFAITDYRSVEIIKSLVASQLENANYFGYIRTLILSLFLSVVAMAGVSYILLKSYKALRTNTPSGSLAVSTSLLFAVIFNYTIQSGVVVGEPLLNRYIFPGATVFQIFIFTCLFLLIYLLINRFLISTFVIVILGTVISIANSIKQGLRNEPLLVTDFVWLKEISLLASFVEKSIIIKSAIEITLIILIYILLRKYILPGRVVQSKRKRGVALAVLLSLGIFTFTVFRNEEDARIVDGIPVVSRLNNWVDINWMGFSKNASYKSLMYVWTKQMTKSIMDVPEGYSHEKILEIEKKYKDRAAQINKERENQIQDQTVVFVLSESFSDPTRLNGVSLSENVIPNISQIRKEYTSGIMISDYYGGGTANMETQSLTGLPYINLSSSVSVMNTEVLPKMSFIPSISDTYEDQNKIAVHLHNGANYSRNIVYKDLGFDTFIALDGTDDKPTQLEFNSSGASDKSTYYAVTSNLSSDTGKFFSVITMQNHIPWNKDEPASITGYGQGMTDDENDTLSSYARLLSDTDSFTQDFLNELSNYEKKITVVFYGDHLPGLYPASMFTSNPESQFETDYFIWSNYETSKLDFTNISSSDFPALLLKQTNSKVSAYYSLLTDLLELKQTPELENEFELTSEELKLVQYDITLGKGYILETGDFFTIQ